MLENQTDEFDLISQEAKFFEDMIVGSNSEMRKVLQSIAKLSKTDINVLIVGENGTGKELVAKAIHKNSPRKDQTFITFDCDSIEPKLMESELFGHVKGAFPEALIDKKGLFEEADQSTLFIKEISNLSNELQGKVLRAIEFNEFRPIGVSKINKADVRVVCSTKKNLEKMVSNNTFRSDLYYRICLTTIFVPTLRQRTEDIPVLAKFLLERSSKKLGKKVSKITNKAMGHLLSYPYPGNIRELEHIITQALLNAEGSTILVEHLPEKVREHSESYDHQLQDAFFNEIDLNNGFKELRKMFERQLIGLYIKEADGNITRAAEQAGIERESFHRILKRLKFPKSRSKRSDQ
ncbi:sigma 54-interacting transcriptional regulator [candidate division CSSED10-310 bacterium]|uniref:Sigma 54-interacting transcriptional regulator n=1 Tax=candidate division CSSED10-310 bacterium TaxID=2855610 RepID=A0ABV6YRV0_UNCC1